MRPTNAHSSLVTLTYIGLISAALYLFFFVALPALD
jgi:hypothetical protein